VMLWGSIDKVSGHPVGKVRRTCPASRKEEKKCQRADPVKKGGAVGHGKGYVDRPYDKGKFTIEAAKGVSLPGFQMKNCLPSFGGSCKGKGRGLDKSSIKEEDLLKRLNKKKKTKSGTVTRRLLYRDLIPTRKKKLTFSRGRGERDSSSRGRIGEGGGGGGEREGVVSRVKSGNKKETALL